VDFPVSLVYVVGGRAYSEWLSMLSDHSVWLAQIFYLPHLVHGLLGTIWWYLMVRFFAARSNRGVG
jgi:hypothetical protein